MNTISIIGTGAIGSAIARLLVHAGLPVSIANSRGPQSLTDLANELGPLARPVTAQEASRADMVFLAVNWSKIPDAVRDLGPWDGRIVIDTNNPIEAPLFQPVDLHGVPSSQVIAQLLPGAHVVKAFNHLLAALLSDPAAEGGKRVLFYSGEHAASKERVAALIADLGFYGIDLGGVQQGLLAQFPGGPLPALNLVKHG
ncbi:MULTISPECIES: NADPH-dependent F420 reductase [unclassified Pseudomonas]|uniref:NADPH-dependent F420 reductase n=1 Tax=unclassified Pseudomonas TaxID=196821 RepID=UPI00215C8862|nr:MULTISPECIES: NADPH-dependent F420 reductase [unclassified Pseudomonas]MCR8930926.1 NADPH-dependent F420 reductase [Pseudomonas sp. S11A4]MCR8974532.1 NADPH-dependent F420 reductase [Pseudomonas sp. S11P7]